MVIAESSVEPGPELWALLPGAKHADKIRAEKTHHTAVTVLLIVSPFE
jgi:hypothetical protein